LEYTHNQEAQSMSATETSEGRKETPREEYARYWSEGQGRGATHFFVVHDTTTEDRFPVYVASGNDPEVVRGRYEPPNHFSEIYDLKEPIEPQLNRSRTLL
jgi:hypothetical protein